MQARGVLVFLLAVIGSAAGRRILQSPNAVASAVNSPGDGAAESPLEAAAGDLSVPEESAAALVPGTGTGKRPAVTLSPPLPAKSPADPPARDLVVSVSPPLVEVATPAEAPPLEGSTLAEPAVTLAATPAKTGISANDVAKLNAAMTVEAEAAAPASAAEVSTVLATPIPDIAIPTSTGPVATAPTAALLPAIIPSTTVSTSKAPSAAAATTVVPTIPTLPEGTSISAEAVSAEIPVLAESTAGLPDDVVVGAPSADNAMAPTPAGPLERVANLLFTMSAKRATITNDGILLEGVSPVVSYVSDVPAKHAGRFNTTFFTSDTFAENGTWLLNPDAVLMGVITAGGPEGSNGTVGAAVVKLSNPVYNASRYALRFDSAVQSPADNALSLLGGNANYQIDEAGDRLLQIDDRTVLMDALVFIDAFADVGVAAKGGAKWGALGGPGYCNPLGSLTSFGCEGGYGYMGYNPGFALGG